MNFRTMSEAVRTVWAAHNGDTACYAAIRSWLNRAGANCVKDLADRFPPSVHLSFLHFLNQIKP